MTVVPPYLKQDDTILIIGTARARGEEAIRPAIETLRSWGLRVETGKHLYKQHHQFAGTDEERAEDLQWAIDHETARAVLVAGGGYGTLRIIDRVDFSNLFRYPKWMAGYSDTTVLHARLTRLGMACIHSTMAFQFPRNEAATTSLKQLLFGETLRYSIALSPLNRPGVAEGEVVGGNLSLLYALSGSGDDLSTKNKILFIEDLDEQLYHIDRMMLQLKRSGKLSGLKGLVVGGMSDMKDNAVPFGKTAEEIIEEAVREYDYPLCFHFPAGHIETNMALYFGKTARLQVNPDKVTLDYLAYDL